MKNHKHSRGSRVEGREPTAFTLMEIMIVVGIIGIIMAAGVPTLYVSGEESSEQLKLRAERLGITGDSFLVLVENELETIVQKMEGADAAVKSAEARLLEIRLAMALGGKAFCVLTGDVAAVRSAVESGKALIGAKGLLVNWAVIPSPDAALVKELLGGRLA